MIPFRKLELTDRDWITARLRESNFQSCDYSFGNNFIWRDSYQILFADVGGFYCAASGGMEHWQYNFPAGSGDVRPVIEALRQDAAERGVPFRLRGMDLASMRLTETLFTGEFSFTENRDTCDYIYSVPRLTSLAGKKLHGKRNHINRFQENNWSYEDITPENIVDAVNMSREWCALYNCTEDPDLNHEACAVDQAFQHFFALGLRGGMLRMEGRVVAFTIGEPLNSDTYVMHIEKAFPEIQGAYPMINQQFLMHNCQDYAYVNREEDLGDEGLRKAKLSYYPDILLQKYTAVPK